MFKTIIEPFRIHSVEPLRMTTAEERRAALRVVDYNLLLAVSYFWGAALPGTAGGGTGLAPFKESP